MRITIDPEQIAKTFSKFSANSSLQESAQLFAQGLPIAEMIKAFAMSESVLRAFAAFESMYPHGNLERGILEKVILRVSQLHECQFCINSHQTIMEKLGINTEVSADMGHTPRERLALRFAELVTRDSNRVPDEFFLELTTAFTESEIVELTFLIGFITMLNRFNNALQIRYRGEFKDVQVC